MTKQERLFVTQGGFIYFGPNGEMGRYHDAASTLRDAEEALHVQGLEPPNGVMV